MIFPHLTCEVNEPNSQTAIDVAPFMSWSGASMQTTISSNFGRQGDTAQIVLVDDYSVVMAGFNVPANSPHFMIKPFSTIVITDQGATSQPAKGIIFAGLVTDPQWRWTAPGRVEWILQCVDFTYYADTSIVQAEYAGLTADYIMVDITTKANCGITAKRVVDGGHVYPGPTIPLANLNYGALSSAWDTITKLASQSQIFGWFVDGNRELWFYPTALSLPSGVTVTDAPTSNVPDINECHIDSSLAYSMIYEWDATTFYTRCIVEGAVITHSYEAAKARKNEIPPTDSWVGNGVQTSWPLSYQPEVSSTTLKAAAGIVSTVGQTAITGAPYLTVGGVVRAVSINDGTTPITTPFQFVQATNGLWTLQVTAGIGSTPSAGTIIKLWYRYKMPIIAVANLGNQQRAIGGPNDGIFSELISDTSLVSSTAAFARAKATLQEYGAPQERITFYTDASWLGWFRCGQTFALHASQVPNSANGYALGLVGTFFVIQQMVIFRQGGFRTTQVTAVRLS